MSRRDDDNEDDSDRRFLDDKESTEKARIEKRIRKRKLKIGMMTIINDDELTEEENTTSQGSQNKTGISYTCK